jgi:hypothetical protein
MKKLVTAFAACMIAGLVSAQTVESQNIVGYNTIGLQTEYTLIAVNFDKVGSGALTINEAFPYQAGVMKAGGLSDSDQILIRTPGTGAYTTYRLRATSTPANSWCSSGITPSTDPMVSGTAAWYLSRLSPAPTNVLNMVVAGEVANDATRSMTIKSGYNLFANPYPYDVALNGAAGIGFQTGMTPGGLSDSDQIQIRNQSTGAYTTYRLRATSTPANSWCSSGITPTTDSLLAGASAWYLARGGSDFQLSMQKPAGL